MNRIQRAMVVAIIGMAILGFGLITAVEAVKPPFMPPAYEGYPGYPDAVRIWPGIVYGSDPLWPDDNIMYQSDASFIFQGWTYWVDEIVDETELFPQPIRVQVEIRKVGSCDDWTEIKLSRNAFGAGHIGNPNFVGPAYLWYAYFEPGYFDVGEYETHIQYTCKDPDNPKNRMFCWDTDPGSPTYGEDINRYGLLLVLEG